MESLLYSTCADLGITVMSIGHSMSLRHHHQFSLHLFSDGSWKLSPISDFHSQSPGGNGDASFILDDSSCLGDEITTSVV